MFTYVKSAFKNAKPQNLITLIITLISFAVIFFVARMASALIMNQLMYVQLYAQMGQSPSAMLVPIIGIVIISLLIFLLLGYQIIAGVFNVMARAIKKEKVHFKDLFIAFRKGNYAKSILLALLTIVLVIILAVILILLRNLYNMAISPLFASLQDSLATNDHATGIMITIQIIITLITGFISSIFLWFFIIAIINYTVAYVESPHQKAMTSFKEGFRGIKNGHKTWFKFFIGILLLNLIIIIIGQPLIYLIMLATSHMSQSVATGIIITVQILAIIVTLALYYMIIMGIVQYFVQRGHKPGNPTDAKVGTTNKDHDRSFDSKHSDRKDDVKNKNTNHHESVSNQVSDKKEAVKDKTSDKLNDMKEQSSSKKENIKDASNHLTDDSKQQASDKANDAKDQAMSKGKEVKDKYNPKN